MKIDKASETWAYIADFCKKKIEEETRAIMHIDCDARRADNARGAIAAYNTILSAADPLVKFEKPADDTSWKRKDRAGI